MKIVRKEEKAILTATEKAILQKALAIMDEITDKAEYNGQLCDAGILVYNALEDFLDSDEIYEVEPSTTIEEVIIKMTV